MEPFELPKNDLVLVVATALGVTIVALSIVCLLNAPLGSGFNKDQFEAYLQLYTLVVKDVLLSLFGTVVAVKVGFVAIRGVAVAIAARRN